MLDVHETSAVAATLSWLLKVRRSVEDYLLKMLEGLFHAVHFRI